jgi:tetratricopeptide (TPR) repeat protein
MGGFMTDQRARELLSEAVDGVLAGKRAESESFARACRFYERSLATLRSITSQYPSSKLATKLTRGELKIGPYTMTELSEQVVPRMRMARGAERNPMLCALLLAEAAGSRIVKDELLSRMAIRYASEGALDKAMGAVRGIERILSRTATLWRMAAVVAREGNEDAARDLLSEALEIAGGIRSGVFRDSVLSQAVEGYTSLGEYGKAFDVAKGIGYMSVRARAIAKIAAGYAQNDLDDQALQLLSRVGDECEQRYAQLLDGEEDVRELGDSSARSLGIPPGAAFTLRILALDMGHFGEKELESSRKDEWSDIVEQLPAQLQSSFADPQSIRGFGVMAMWQQNMDEYTRTVTDIYRGMAKKYVEKGEWGRALELARSVEDDAYGNDIRATVAQKLAEQGEINHGMEVARRIDDDFQRTTTLAALVKQCVLSGSTRKMREMLEMADNPAQKTKLLLEAAQAHADAGRRVRAQSMLAQALSSTQMMEESFSRNWFLEKVASCYVANADFEKARGVLGEVEDPHTRIGVLLGIAAGQLALRSRAAMHETLNEALRTAERIESPGVRAAALTQIAFVMAKARRTEEAADVLREALGASRAMEEQYRSSGTVGEGGSAESEPDRAPAMQVPFYDSASESIAVGFAAIGRQPEAVRVILEMPPGHRADSVSLRLSRRYAKAGRYETALGLVRMIDDSRTRILALAEIGERCREQGRKLGRKAERVLHEMVAETLRTENGATD